MLYCVLNCYLRFWMQRGKPSYLHSTVTCPASTNVAVERVHTSGQMLGYHEVPVCKYLSGKVAHKTVLLTVTLSAICSN